MSRFAATDASHSAANCVDCRGLSRRRFLGGLAAGAVLAFARALGEFGATIMLAGFIPGQTATLALSIYHLVQLGRDREALALLAISVTIAFAAVGVSEWFLRRRSP